MRARWWLVLGGVCGLLVGIGFVLGAQYGGPETAPERDVAPAAVPAAVAAEGEAAAHPPASTLEAAEGQRLLSRIEQLEVLLAAARKSGGETSAMVRPGDVEELPPDETEPLPFGPELAPAYTPEGFQAVALQMERECGLGLEVVAIDCSEYPCMAWTRAENPAGRRLSMDACAPWTDAFPNGTTVIGSATRDGANGQKEVYVAWMAVPEDPEQIKHAWRRAKLRAGEMHSALGFE